MVMKFSDISSTKQDVLFIILKCHYSLIVEKMWIFYLFLELQSDK